MNISVPTILVIFGISGDLAKRKLLPALGHMAEQRILPPQFHIIGITRKSTILLDDLLEHTNNKDYIRTHSELFEMDLTIQSEYTRLSKEIERIKEEFSPSTQVLFYLSVPPNVSGSIIEFLGQSGISKMNTIKLLLEKPSGFDLESARKLIEHTHQYFNPEQVYRVDHYLAKETAQNIIPFRERNTDIEKTLNKDSVLGIEVTASEVIGIEGRAIFYEQTGSLRDLIQSHLLEISTLVLMDISPDLAMTIPERRRKALSYLRVSSDAPVIRGQYEGYKDEVANPESTVETFVSLTLESTDPRWIDIPIRLTTGKALHEKYTEIKIIFKEKEPLIFHFQDQKRDAHEYVLENAMNSNHDLFVSSREVLETWRIIDEVQKKWKTRSDDLILYKKGSTIEDILTKLA